MFNNFPNYSYSGYPYTQNYNTSQPQFQPQQTQPSGINWVQGEAGAKSYQISPGQHVMLMDSENYVFYIKSSDPSGMPMPLRIFDYKERTSQNNQQPQQNNNNEYITRKEFEKRISEIKNGKQSVQSTQ